MSIATTSDTTRIFIDRAEFSKVMTTEQLQQHLAHTNSEVFRMAGRIGIDCRTIELLQVAGILKALDLI